MKITVDLAANTAQFNSEFKRAEQTVRDRMGNIEDAAKKAGVAIGAALAAGATAAAVALKRAIDRMDQIGEAASRIGIATEALSGLEWAAKLSDASLEQLQGGLLRLTKNAGDAAAGNKALAQAFGAIGVSVTNADGSLRNVEGLLLDVADVFAQLPNGAEKSKLALDLFGRSGAQLIPLLSRGSEGINELRAEAEALGLTFDQTAAEQAGDFNDAIDRVTAGMQGAATQIGIGLLPKLTEMAAVLQSEAFRDGFGAIIEGAATAAIKVAELVAEIGNLTRFAADEVASRVAGPNFGDTVRIEDAIARQREQLEFMRGGLLNSIFPPDETSPGIAAATAELARLEELLRLSTEAAEQAAIAEHNRAGAQTEGTAATGENSTATNALLEALRRMREEQAAEADAARQSAGAQRERAKASNDAAKAMEAATRAAAQANQRAAGATASLNQLLRQQAAALGGPLVQASQRYAAELEYIAELEADMQQVGALSAQQAQALETAREQANQQWVEDLEDIQDAADEAGRYLEDLVGYLTDTPLRRMADDAELLGQALEDALAGKGKIAAEELQAALGDVRHSMNVAMITSTQEGLRSIQSMTQSGSKAFAAMQVAIDALSVAQAISAVLNQGNGDPYTAFARMAAMAAAVATLVGNIGGNFGGSNGFTDTAADRQATQGRGTVLGDAEAQSASIQNALDIIADATSQLPGLNRGILTSLQALQGGLDRAGGMLARGAGQAGFTEIGGRFDVGGAFLGGLFGSLATRVLDPLGILGGSSQITDQGLAIGGGSLGNVGVQAFQEQQYRRWRFGSRRTREEMAPVDDAVESQFQLIIDSIVETVRRGAEALGLLPADVQARLDAFTLEVTRISLKDLSAEEQQAELLAVFSSIFDNIAGDVVPFIEQFQRVGEGLGETLVRVATGVQVTQEGLRRLGFSLDELDPERFAQVSEALIEMVGGLDAFIEGMQSFMDAFAPEAYRFQLLQEDLTSALEQAGLVLPETRDGMWALMQSLDATTEAGREQIATLLRLAGTADQYYRMIEDGAGTELEDRRDHLQELLEANREYYDFAERIAQQFLGSVGSELNNSLVDIEREYRNNIRTANELARAAGMSGAAVQELSRIELIAARRRAEAIRLTMESALENAADLGLTEMSQLDAQIAALQDTGGQLGDALGGVSDAFDEAAQRAKNTIDLLIGDLSPLRDQQKLQIALEGLRAGTVSADQVLQIGRRLYASGADYRTLFDQVLAIQATAPIGGGGGPVGGGGGPAPVSPELLALIARRDELLADQAAEEARANALTLVEQIAELADGQTMSFEQVAASLGISLTDLAERLGVDSETLTMMLQRQADEAAEEREAVLEIPERFSDAVQPLQAELETLNELVRLQGEQLAQIAANTGRTAGAAESQAETAANRDLVDTSVAPRSTRIGTGSGGSTGTGVFGPVLAL
jgi:DNA-binding Xre family transcriptional regulator